MHNPHWLLCLVCCLFALLQTVFFLFWKQHCMTPHHFHNNARWDYILKTLHFSTFSPWFKSQEWVPHWQNNEFGSCRSGQRNWKREISWRENTFLLPNAKSNHRHVLQWKKMLLSVHSRNVVRTAGFSFLLSYRWGKRRGEHVLLLMMCYLHSNNQSWLHNFPVTESTLTNAWEESKRIIISWLYQIVFVGCDDTKDDNVGSR